MICELQIEVKMAQPRSQRDQARNIHGGREPYFNDRESRTPPMNVPFVPPQQANPAAANMLYQRMMGQMPLMPGGNIPNIPMMNGMGVGMGMGGMGMNAYNQMGGMNPMAGIGLMGGMNPMMAALNPMGNMRMGMGPMGGMAGIAAQGGMGTAVGSTGMASMNGMGMGMRQGMGVVNPNFNRMAMYSGPGPARTTSRGQHSFHPYGRERTL